MSGLPRTSAMNTAGHCTGDWAGHTPTDDRHCVCWWDDRGPCCQCGQHPDRYARNGIATEATTTA